MSCVGRYAVSDAAYRAMRREFHDQCVLISGESGSGKTEASKKILHYIATCNHQESNEIDRVKDRLLQSNPILEVYTQTMHANMWLIIRRPLVMPRRTGMITRVDLENTWMFSSILRWEFGSSQYSNYGCASSRNTSIHYSRLLIFGIYWMRFLQIERRVRVTLVAKDSHTWPCICDHCKDVTWQVDIL